ncbi:hypothetical protein Q3G72_006309 [Acer saccharum]|nr:hypothetical protein Q3G72_006309 [Acer saccharum]
MNDHDGVGVPARWLSGNSPTKTLRRRVDVATKTLLFLVAATAKVAGNRGKVDDGDCNHEMGFGLGSRSLIGSPHVQFVIVKLPSSSVRRTPELFSIGLYRLASQQGLSQSFLYHIDRPAAAAALYMRHKLADHIERK